MSHISVTPSVVILLITLSSLLYSSECTDIIITPLPRQQCRVQGCTTLSDLAASPPSDKNMTLIMLPGNYNLDTNITFSDMDELRLYSDFNVKIECAPSSSLSFESIERVFIRNLNFVGCGGNLANNVVGEFLIEDTTFEGKGDSGTSLTLNNTTAEIRNCTFVRNHFGSRKQSVRTLVQLTTDINWFLVGDVTGIIRVGGAIISSFSNVGISNCKFLNNRAEVGGDIFTEDNSRITIFNTTFSNEDLLKDSDEPPFGGSIFAFEGDFAVEGSLFVNKQATVGGAIITSLSNFTVNNTKFLSNRATDHGASFFAYNATAFIQGCHFENNTAGAGAGVASQQITITVENSKFISNTAERHAAALDFYLDTPTIRGCVFVNNVAHSFAGAILMWGTEGVFFGDASDSFGGTETCNNDIDGGCYDNSTSLEADIDLYDWTQVEAGRGTIFISNSAPIGGAIYLIKSTVRSCGSMFFSNNSAAVYATIYVLDSNGTFEGQTVVYKSVGSLFAFNSRLIFSGCTVFTNSSPPVDSTTNFEEGGALTVVQTSVYFSGETRFELNHAEVGGAMVATESSIYLRNKVSMIQNYAIKNGGAFYLSQSDIVGTRGSVVVISGNKANEKGGAVHAVSSSVKVTVSGSKTTDMSGDMAREEYIGGIMNIVNNTARLGGALFLGDNSKVTLLKDYIFETLNLSALNFFGNKAEFGGAIYVDDESNSGGCASNPYDIDAPRSECFIRVVATHSILTASPNYTLNNIDFDLNSADGNSSILFGGLLDRCSVSLFNEVDRTLDLNDNQFQMYTGDGLQYLFDISTGVTTDTISSLPVQICPCVDNQPVCNEFKVPTINVKKGRTFEVPVIAVDHVYRPVNATIQAYLDSTASDLINGQVTPISNVCTNIPFRIISPHDSERLTMYASGPCQDAKLSRLSVNISFEECTCPIGFQPSTSFTTVRCSCTCDSRLAPFVESCNSSTQTVTRSVNVWMSHVINRNTSGYLVHKYCPFDYCIKPNSTEAINLNEKSGEDAQCALNRTGSLCGACKPGLSLSLGSSLCLECPSYWPALFVGITIFAILAGLGLVILVLWLNLTVAVGTLNGLLFYANIVSANRIIVLPYPEPNLITVFISWLNLDLGIDLCYVDGMDIYIKTWLTLAFPIYIIFLVILLIIISRYSSRFSQLLSKRDPVAALATLILISYGKLFHVVLLAQPFSFAALRYPDGSTRVLWLPDGTVEYFSVKHIILVIVALVILIVCILYSLLFLVWQLILRAPNWKILKCFRYPSVHLYMAAHHVPFVPRHRYWIGLLLLARAVLYLIAAANVSGNPQIQLISTIIVVAFIVLLKMVVATRIFKNVLIDALESFFYINIIVFSAFTSYNLSTGGNQDGIAYTSVVLSIVMTILIIVFHVFKFTSIRTRLGKTKIGMKIKDRFKRASKPRVEAARPEITDDSIRRFDDIFDLGDFSGITSTSSSTDYHNAEVMYRKPTCSVIETPTDKN